MTRICKLSSKKLLLYILIFSLSLFSLFSSENKEWTVAAQEFTFAKGQKENSVTKGIAESIPKNILENLNQTLERNIRADETLERKSYDLLKKRQSLYLQLSSVYQKRDALFLSYDGKKLEKKIKESEKEIEKINKQINDNLNELKKAEEDSKKLLGTIKALKDSDRPISEVEKMKGFFKNIVTNEKAVIPSEKIKLYNNDSTVLYTPSDEAMKRGYESAFFAEEMYSKNINSLITGSISSYGKYISINVNLYSYPGSRLIGSVTEIGSTNEMELLVSSIVRQLIPLLTNSMPVQVNFDIKPEVPIEYVSIYIDDVLQKTNNNKIVINSGVHTFQIACEGYKTLSTSYYFEGNVDYDIDIKLEEKNEGELNLNIRNGMVGTIYTNGLLAQKNDDFYKIRINGTNVLGEFITEDGKTSFFYIPEKLYFDQNYVTIKPNPIDRAEKIDKRRRMMYGAYSGFMISLIPTFITRGILDNKIQSYKDGHIPYNNYTAWNTTYNVFAGISIGLGVFWAFELVRYLISADSVLPEKAKQMDMDDYYLKQMITPQTTDEDSSLTDKENVVSEEKQNKEEENNIENIAN